MRVLNPPDISRIVQSVEMVRDLSTADTPYEVLNTFASRYWPLHPIDHMVSISRAGLPDEPPPASPAYRITRNIDVRAAVTGRQPVASGPPVIPQIPLSRGGFIGWAIEQARPLLIHDLDVRDDPALGDAIARMGSAMCLPLYDAGVPRYWNFQFKRERDAFTLLDLEEALLTANLVGGTNSRLVLVQEVKRLNAALTQQFEEVARVQRSLLPREIPAIPGLQIATSYLTSDQAGGDYYDFFRLDGGRWGILIADVSGHGPAAATIMAMLHGILHAYADKGGTPDAVLRHANRHLYDASLEGSFVTAFFAIFDPATARLSFARSGHNPPLLKDGRTGELRQLDGDGSPPLGLFEPYELATETLQLRPMDTLILYTDGITEAFNGDRRMFGQEGLDAALISCSGAPDCVIDSVHAALYQHTGSRTRVDDQTLVALRYTGRLP